MQCNTTHTIYPGGLALFPMRRNKSECAKIRTKKCKLGSARGNWKARERARTCNLHTSLVPSSCSCLARRCSSCCPSSPCWPCPSNSQSNCSVSTLAHELYGKNLPTNWVSVLSPLNILVKIDLWFNCFRQGLLSSPDCTIGHYVFLSIINE